MGYSIQQAVAEVQRDILASGRAGFAAARARWRSIGPRLSKADFTRLAQEGMGFRASVAMHESRYGSPGTLPGTRVSVGATSVVAEPVRVLVRICYETRTGEVKALVRFTRDDTLYVAEMARSRAVGYMALARFMEKAHGLLAQHRKQTIGALPEEVQRELEEKWPG